MGKITVSPHTHARKLLKMQITLKTLQQQTFKIDIDAEETVRDIHSAEGLETRGRESYRVAKLC